MNSKKRLYLVSAALLLVGQSAALLAYLGAEREKTDLVRKGIESSKNYVHGLELYGGKMYVLSDRFLRWFESLWHGEALATTIAVLTIVVCSALFFIAYNLPGPDFENEPPSGH